MRVLVTDGDSRAALALVRALGAAGHWVAVGERTTPGIAQTSRYCAYRFEYPDPAKDEQGFVECVCKAIDELQIDVLLPVADISTMALTGVRDRLPACCRLPFAPAETILKAADKVGVLKAAMRLGVPIPKTVVVERPDALPASIDLPFPLVIKPARSRVRTSTGWISCSVSYAATPEALAKQVSERRPEEFPLALQEKIVGPGVGVFLCYNAGAPIALFAHRRLREKPPSGGVSVLSESVPMSPAAQRYAEQILADLGWQGVAMVEFKHDERDGIPKLMEITGRVWGSLPLAIDAGVDFPNILLSTLNGKAPKTLPAYRVGVRNRWFWGDVDSLLIELGGAGTIRTPGLRGRLQALAHFLPLWSRDLHYENPKWDDLRPWLHETRHWLRGVR